MEDSKIIAMYFERNEEAISQTGKKYGGYCFKIAHNILQSREDCEECVNDTYLAAWNRIPPDTPVILSAFLGRITRNLSLKKYRDGRAKKRGGGEAELTLDELYECIPQDGSVYDRLDTMQLAKIIEDFLRQLPADDRRLFMRRYWYFDPIAEICRSLSLNEGQAKMQLMRLRQKLLLKLTEEEFNL